MLTLTKFIKLETASDYSVYNCYNVKLSHLNDAMNATSSKQTKKEVFVFDSQIFCVSTCLIHGDKKVYLFDEQK